MSRNIVFTGLCTLGLSVGTALAADTFNSFDYPNATSTTAIGINADGAVVGKYLDNAGAQHGFLLREGQFTSIDYPGAVFTVANGINSQGDIVGCHIEDATRIPNSIGCHGYLLHQGTFNSIDYPGKYGAIAARINDAGQIVGCNHDDTGPGGAMSDGMHGFMYSNGTYTQLSTNMTMNWSLTADGSVTTGIVTMNGATHGYLAIGDTLVVFDFPFATLTNPMDMTPSGDVIVGGYIDAAKATHGFLMRLADSSGTFGGLTGPVTFITIDYPGATRTVVRGINPQGDMVGNYVDAAGKSHGFFLSRRPHHED
jgi:uncharacterized membrane protein